MPETILPLPAEGITPVAPGQPAGAENGLLPADPLAAEGFPATLAIELSQLAPDSTVLPDAPEGLVDALSEPLAGMDLPLAGGMDLPFAVTMALPPPVTGVQLFPVAEPSLAEGSGGTEQALLMEKTVERTLVPGPPVPRAAESGIRSMPEPLRAASAPGEAPAMDSGRTPAGVPGTVAGEATPEAEPIIKTLSDSTPATVADGQSNNVRLDARPSVTMAAEPTRQPDVLVPRFELPEAPQGPRWNESLGNRVAWMATNQVQRAELRLNPPALGPLEVRVEVNQEEARVVFSAQHGAVREALEAAVPRLRELMGAHGLNLVQVDVSGQGLARDSERNDWPGRDSAPGGSGTGRAPGGESLQAGAPAQLRVGLVDDYA